MTNFKESVRMRSSIFFYNSMKPPEIRPVTGVDLKVTGTCNLRCPQCVNADGPVKNDDVDVSAVVRALHELKDAPDDLSRLDSVFFTGGEPFKKLELVQAIMKQIPLDTFTSVVTNGTLVTRDAILKLKDLGLNRLKFSYDTTDPNAFVQIRRGATREQLVNIERNIETASTEGILTYMRIAFGKKNRGVLREIYQKAVDLGADTLQIKPMVPSGRAVENRDDLCMTKDEFMESFRDLWTIYDDTKTKISISCFPPALDIGFFAKYCANNQKFYMETDGRLYTCNYIMDEHNLIGNYREAGGLTQALKDRKQRFFDLFGENNVIKNCPSKQNYC